MRHRASTIPAVEHVVGFTGVGSGGGGGADQHGLGLRLARSRSRERGRRIDDGDRPAAAAALPWCRAAALFLAAVQDIRAGGRQSNAAYQYTLQADNTDDLYQWAPKLIDGAGAQPGAARRQFRPAAERPGNRSRDRPRRPPRGSASPPREIDNTLYDAFGQRQVSTIYSAKNQYHVVMEVAPHYWQSPADARRHLRLRPRAAAPQASAPSNASGRHGSRRSHDQDGRRHDRRPRRPRQSPATIPRATRRPTRWPQPARAAHRPAPRSAPRKETMVPLAAFATYAPATRRSAVNHQGLVRRQPPSRSIWRRASRSATRRPRSTRPMRQIDMPTSIHGSLAGHRADVPAIAEQPCRS